MQIAPPLVSERAVLDELVDVSADVLGAASAETSPADARGGGALRA